MGALRWAASWRLGGGRWAPNLDVCWWAPAHASVRLQPPCPYLSCAVLRFRSLPGAVQRPGIRVLFVYPCIAIDGPDPSNTPPAALHSLCQALRDGQIEQVMDESIELHHFFKAYSRNK